jgi:mRNA interferase MazF
VAVDAANGLAGPSVISCDNITTIPTSRLGAQIGVLLDRQEPALSEAIRAAFDLD